MSNVRLLQGDCLGKLKELADNSVDSIVTDPPAGIGFMSKDWDSDKGGAWHWISWMQGVAEECKRVLKPGGHALVWSIPRTSHWTGTAWEMAGFETRDKIYHAFGSGFPKSQNVSKAIDKAAGAEGEIIGKAVGMGKQNPEWNETAQGRAENSFKPEYDKTKPTTPEAQQWDGWGTALKPAIEEWWLMRKPLSEKTIAENVLKWRTGAINIDGCRVGMKSFLNKGRYPANFIHDGSEEVVQFFPNTKSGASAKGGHKRSQENMRKGSTIYGNGRGIAGTSSTDDAGNLYGDSGSAARFFYCAKASKRDRDEGLSDFVEKEEGIKNTNGRGFSESDPMKKILQRNNHPTVKNVELMRYLCKLITPLNGTVLDPFMGSGSTGKGAILEGFSFIGIELDKEYLEIAQARIEYAKELVKKEQKEKIENLW